MPWIFPLGLLANGMAVHVGVDPDQAQPLAGTEAATDAGPRADGAGMISADD